jgi:hypothetical protein
MKKSFERLKSLSGRVVLILRRLLLQITVSFKYIYKRKATVGTDLSEK